MNEQPRKPAHGAGADRARRGAAESDAGGAPEGSAGLGNGRHTPAEPLHPWQGGPSTPGSRVPAPPFAPNGQATPPPHPRSSEASQRGSAQQGSEQSGAAPSGAAQPGAAQSGVPESDPARPEPPRLSPRPLQLPAIDSEQASTFGRPNGVHGSFDPAQPTRETPQVVQAPPPPEALTKAFGRPPGHDETLQRAPGERPPEHGPAPEATFWNEREGRDPWRDPAATAVIGPPAVPEDAAAKPTEADEGPLLSTREVLFGRRVHPRTLAVLAGIAVLLSVVGGFIGRITAEEGNPLTNPDVTLAEVEPAGDQPRGSVAKVAQRIVPAVVSVEVRVGSQGGTGSGVVIDGDGYVVTNNHVVSMAADTPNAKVSTVFHDGTRAPARIVGRDVKTDLAVLKVDVANPTVAQLGSSDELVVGEDVIAVGSPLGLASTVTTGIVSTVHRPVRLAGEGTDTNAVIDAIQTDAAINPGNSGGALVDSNGAVIGINSAIRTLGSGGEGGSIGLGFAIPIDDVRRIATELIRTGHVRHADLGVNAKSVSDGVADGAQVQNVQDGSAAAAAGIAEGDVIIRVGERKVGSADELIVAVDRYQSGQTVPVTIVRGGRELVLNAKLG